MDLTETIAPKSDQLNAEDLLTGPRTFTVAEVKKGSSEQPVDIHLVEFPERPFRPSKTVRRILVNAWGAEASAYTGRRMTLYRDPAVKFGGMDVGGIRVSHLSHIDKPISVALTVSRGKRQPYTVKPLVEEYDARAHQPATDDGAADGGEAPVAPSRPGYDSLTGAAIPYGPGALIDPKSPTSRKMYALLRNVGDNVAVLAWLSDRVGRTITSSKELTQGEQSHIVDALVALEAAS